MSRNLGQNSPPNNPMVKFGTTPTQYNTQLQIKMVKLVCPFKWNLFFSATFCTCMALLSLQLYFFSLWMKSYGVIMKLFSSTYP